MTDDSDRPMRPSEKLCALLGLPPPRPLTAEERASFAEKHREADARLDALLARNRAERSG